MMKDPLTRRFLGEIFPEPKTFQSFPFAPSPMPATATSKHVYLVVSDFVANTFLHSAKVKGVANQSFSAADDDTIKNLLGEGIVTSSGRKRASFAYTFTHVRPSCVAFGTCLPCAAFVSHEL